MTDPMPTPQQVRRALARAERGAALDVGEATALLAATGEDLDRLTAVAARVRDAGLVAAGRPGVVTYSPKVFIPMTRLCRDRCHYCTFVESPAPGRARGAGAVPVAGRDPGDRAEGAALGCLEALFTLGDRPEDRWPEAREWLDERGYDSTLAYVRAMAVRVLEETGLLPHLNPGVMSWEEMTRLKPVSPSMGMMLETTSRRLFETKGLAHFGSPDKDPDVRLRVLEDAGRLSVPFTSGLLVGIGETLVERAETVFALRAVARRYGGLQEVIVQNFRAKPDTAMRHVDDLGARRVPRRDRGHPDRARAEGARPGAAQPGRPSAECRALLDAGVDDWGGVSPLTPDHVNPERPWPLAGPVAGDHGGGRLRAAAAAHRAPGVRPGGRAVAGPADHLARRRARRAGRPGPRRRTAGRSAVAGARRRLPRPAGSRPHRPARAPSTPRAASADRRADFDSVYGDWDELRTAVVRRRERVRPGQRVADAHRGRLGRAARRRERPGRADRRAGAGPDDRGRSSSWSRCAGWPTTCAATRSATR